MTPTPGFWHGRRVVVIGHTGFKGSWLCAWLEQLGALTCGISLPPDTEPSLCTLTRIEQRVETVHIDIRDGSNLQEAITRFAPEIILHLAAQSLVRRSYQEPVKTFATNVMGTINVLEAVRKTPSVRAVVVVTSDKCYENNESPRLYRESDALGGADPYSASKACAELIRGLAAMIFSHDHRVMLASARAGNVIGGGDWAPDRLIPDCVAAMVAGRPIRNPQPARNSSVATRTRPAPGYLILAERLFNDGAAFARAWNFGPSTEDACSVAQIVDEIIARWGQPANGSGRRSRRTRSRPPRDRCLDGACRPGLGSTPVAQGGSVVDH